MVERGFSLYTKEQCQRPIHSWRRAWRARATPSMEASGAKVIRAPRRGCGWRRHGLRGKKVLQIVSYGRLFSRPARFPWTPGGHACRPARCPSRCPSDISMTGLQANSTAATGRSVHPAAARMRATSVPLSAWPTRPWPRRVRVGSRGVQALVLKAAARLSLRPLRLCGVHALQGPRRHLLSGSHPRCPLPRPAASQPNLQCVARCSRRHVALLGRRNTHRNRCRSFFCRGPREISKILTTTATPRRACAKWPWLDSGGLRW